MADNATFLLNKLNTYQIQMELIAPTLRLAMVDSYETYDVCDRESIWYCNCMESQLHAQCAVSRGKVSRRQKLFFFLRGSEPEHAQYC